MCVRERVSADCERGRRLEGKTRKESVDEEEKEAPAETY